ncbi:hypothetical protein HN747_02175 [archaeon]|jgi:hypothetical protein|nr:hypothetical protein [archaeon]
MAIKIYTANPGEASRRQREERLAGIVSIMRNHSYKTVLETYKEHGIMEKAVRYIRERRLD